MSTSILKHIFNLASIGSPDNTVTIAADITKLGEILTYLKNDMQKNKLSKKAQFNMMTAAEEIFSNIAQYAYKNNCTGTVTIKTEIFDDIYSITFMDSGKKYNPLNNPVPDISINIKEKEIGGLGIFLAKTLTDAQSYVYRNKQNILTIGIDINKI